MNLPSTANLFSLIDKVIDKELMKLALILTLTFGFLAYGFGYFNLTDSHDSLYHDLRGQGYWQLSIGRPFTSFVYSLFDSYNLKPLLGGGLV